MYFQEVRYAKRNQNDLLIAFFIFRELLFDPFPNCYSKYNYLFET